ncbi:sporulation delaying protein family toxin [Viridibacillus sp. YIM B01967]|uniref:Sporulation delaying protein family toxin n=1 Tax=Viridibacillus soli TaxID=2798301 RepID=A0ABS1H842_9BACL|nr:sporulation delaying protein family toxin [Viridibacillus soli]MBK3495587.1 sporulation delaying protein family toxin [Viridibacillus soli]
MKKFKKIIPIIMALGLAISSTSVFAAENTNSNTHKKTAITSEMKKQKYDGETIYRGLFFGDGPVAKLFPEIWSDKLMTEANTTEAKRVSKTISKKINELDPNYFNELEVAVKSGDNVKVQAALVKGGNLLVKVSEGIQKTKVGGRGTAFGCSLVAGCIVAVYAAGAVTTAVVVTHAGAITAAVAVVAWKWTPKSMTDTELQLKHEMFVDKVTTTFAD